jgi:hypothetical protein
MQKVIVLKPFNYSPDGLKSVRYVEGDEPELKDSVIEGLEKEGFIVVGLPAPTDSDEAAAALKQPEPASPAPAQAAVLDLAPAREGAPVRNERPPNPRHAEQTAAPESKTLAAPATTPARHKK